MLFIHFYLISLNLRRVGNIVLISQLTGKCQVGEVIAQESKQQLELQPADGKRLLSV